MKYIKIKDTDLNVSQISLGCMRISQMSVEEVEVLIDTALSLGINFFDHADIYGGGKSESLFGEVLKKRPELRQKMIIQTKCGICKGYYDLSKAHIIDSVNQSLQRLNVEYIDVLLLHRPDALMDVQEVAEAFNELYESGKVKYFGVSNMNVYQIELLQKYTTHPLCFNQLQLSVVHASMIDQGINVNMNNLVAIDRDGEILDYCRLKGITIQPWSILQASWEEGTFLNHPSYQPLNDVLNELALKYNVTPSAIALAWILRHPAKMQPVTGTTSCIHLKELCKAVDVSLSRQEWYKLYLSVNRQLP